MLIVLSPGRRSVGNALMGSKIDAQIAEFINVFQNLRDRFTQRGVLAIELELAVLEDIRAFS